MNFHLLSFNFCPLSTAGAIICFTGQLSPYPSHTNLGIATNSQEGRTISMSQGHFWCIYPWFIYPLRDFFLSKVCFLNSETLPCQTSFFLYNPLTWICLIKNIRRAILKSNAFATSSKMSLSKLLITRTNYSFHFESGLMSSLQPRVYFSFHT